ncbi:hypothetical protein NQ166_06700 [Microbacterium sp. zg.Y1090]|uniref:hypothetical protein n=1 Tax=Microbacterium TaxID=33882 RepID=UPI00214B7125|nr:MULTISPECIES: hypothetical protein [unclassified Microbacterium]MCR2812033.1 hypothetical protein [Microbacterium sp. zg.Y1084]MCR2818528.1 hypothetical protein [Microbacterium sp. zg.Y1090]MDL5486341.1 hypothetical protein [Microbacterium sp. zg-Y1211]WIM29536.1 hypothetical protein QNO26_06510 [Microbacterium sp. zg-Y1090]
MADEKVHRIHTLADDAPWAAGSLPTATVDNPLLVRMLDRVLAIQRPAVVAHLRSIRLRHPDAGTAEIARILERRYLAAVTGGGATVGATAVVPGIGTGVTLALGGVETLGFLEATALYAQSMSELHGIPVDDPDRARALVLTLMLGREGIDLVSQLAGQAAGKGVTRDKYWGEMITKTLPRAAVGPLVDRLKSTFVRQFAAKGGASVLGKALPFGIGAAVGGTGNHILGRRVLANARRGFGAPPATYPPELEPKEGAIRLEHAALRGARRAGGALAAAGSGAAHGVQWAARRVGGVVRPGRRAIERRSDTGDDPAGAAAALDAD